MKSSIYLTAALLIGLNSFIFAQPITQVTGFGSNPGNLNMYKYAPTGISNPAPLVVALHGCTQSATIYAQQTGWNKLADLHQFYVIYPEQIALNNSSKCFNWFEPNDVAKNQGEALSIKQMVDYMITNYSIDASAVYVTGLSAGAAMSSVMLADYPEIFSKGAIMAGVPYKAATSSLNAFTAMNGGVTKTPSQWGDLVRNQNPSYTGTQPHVSIFHGTTDFTVNIANATELIKQWTDVNGIDQTVDQTVTAFNGNSNVEKTVYTDNASNPVVMLYKVTGMGHAISLDTGACPKQGGVTGTYALEKDFHSTYWAAEFFNLITLPYSISGATMVAFLASNETYSVPATTGSNYNWIVPTGATIANGQGTNSITVNFGTVSGSVQVIETTSGNCVLDTVSLHVEVGSSGIVHTQAEELLFYYNTADNCIIVKNGDLKDFKELTVYNTLGQQMKNDYSVENNKIAFTSSLAQGVYIVTITTSQHRYTFKMAVNKQW